MTDNDQRRLVTWIERKGGSVTARDVQQGCRWLRASGKAELALNALAKAGGGNWVSTAPGKDGRPTRCFHLPRTPAVDETPVVDDPPAAVNETPAAVNETPAAVNETPAAVNETPAAVDETPAAVNETLSTPHGVADAAELDGDPVIQTPMIPDGIHPIAELFPAMPQAEFDALRDDIGERGLIEPIWLYRGLIVDGRHRYRACLAAGVNPTYREYEGDDPLGFVLAMNLKRRHLNESQRAMLAAQVANVPQGQLPKGLPVSLRIDQRQAAKMLNVSRSSVQAAVIIAKEAPDLAEQVRIGGTTVKVAVRAIKERRREARREVNRAKVAEAPPVLATLTDTAGKFATIVVDPPWDWGDEGEGEGDQCGRARPTYATIPIEQLLELPVGLLADENCHLYLWITNRSLLKGGGLLERWGFRYITVLTWAKPSIGLGTYFRGQTEQVLFGVRGSLRLKRKDASTLFHAPRGPDGHSSKPVEFLAFVESCSPGPYLEMFSRRERPGWHSYGVVDERP